MSGSLKRRSGSGAWKVAERKIAEFFGLKRNILSGNSTADVTPGDTRRVDDDSPNIVVEVKRRSGTIRGFAVSGVHDKLKQELKKAKMDAVPVVALKEARRHGFYIVLHSSDLDRFIEEYASWRSKCQA